MAEALDASAVGRAFSNAVLASQASFRTLLAAMARPGFTQRLEAEIEHPTGLSPAATIALLTLCDHDTPVWLPEPLRDGATGAYIRFHCGAPLVESPRAARFGVLAEPLNGPSLAAFDQGEDRYPDRSATLIVETLSLSGGDPVRLSGPGVNGTVMIGPAGLDAGFWEAWRANHAAFPLGVDAFLVSGREAVGLPRSTAAERI